MANYLVLKQFSGDRLFKVGETVTLDGRNVQKLIDMRYLAEAATVEAPSPPVAPAAALEVTPQRRGRGRPRKVLQTSVATPAPV